jgi:hypothetical protein
MDCATESLVTGVGQSIGVSISHRQKSLCPRRRGWTLISGSRVSRLSVAIPSSIALACHNAVDRRVPELGWMIGNT